MKGLKRALAIFLALGMLFVFAACSGTNGTDENTEDNPSADNPAADDPNFIGKGANGDPNLRLPKLNITDNKIQILCHYEIAHPEAGLEGVFQTVYKMDWETIVVAPEERINKFVALVMGGDAPDMFQYDYFTPSLFTKGYSQPWDDYIDFNSNLWKDIKTSLDLVGFQNKHYYIGSTAGARWEYMVWYNKEIFEENGVKTPKEYYDEGNWTWDTFRECAKALTIDADSNGEPEVFGCCIDQPNGFVYSTGKELVTYNTDGTATNNIKSEEIARCVQFFTDLHVKDKVVYQGNDGPDLFLQGTIAMDFGPSWIRTKWVDMVKADKVGFVPPPKDPNADKYYIFQSTGAWYMGKDCDNPYGAAAYANAGRYTAIDKNGGLTPEQVEQAYQIQVEKDGWTKEYQELYKEMFDGEDKTPVLSTWVTFTMYNYWGDIWFRPRQGEAWATVAEEIAPKIDQEIEKVMNG